MIISSFTSSCSVAHKNIFTHRSHAQQYVINTDVLLMRQRCNEEQTFAGKAAIYLPRVLRILPLQFAYAAPFLAIREAWLSRMMTYVVARCGLAGAAQLPKHWKITQSVSHVKRFCLPHNLTAKNLENFFCPFFLLHAHKIRLLLA